MKLRDFQTEAVQAVFREWQDNKSTLLVQPTGTGKTVTFAHILKQVGGRSIVLAHREELIFQAKRTIEAVCSEWECDIEMAEYKASENAALFDRAPVVIATVQTMIKRMEKFDPYDFSVLVIDECFPAGTLIDGRPIETITEGDLVWSVDKDQVLEKQRVTRLFKSPVKRSLIRIRFSSGQELVCTPGHPIFTKTDGYLPARELAIGDTVRNILGASDVECVEPVEDMERLCPDGFVYNLEVQENHNYFANDILVHNCHHATADTYRKIINYFTQNPDLRVLGVTATPDRADEEALGQIFDSVAYDYEILDAIHDGWLVHPEQLFVSIGDLDFSACRTTAGDLNGGDLARVVEEESIVHGMVGASKELLDGRQAIFFAATVRHAEMACEIFQREPAVSAAFVCGQTNKELRRDIFKQFLNKEVQVLTNVGVACLDSQTEVLTRQGWVGCSAITNRHDVACWLDGEIWFAPPLAIEVRERRMNEEMVFLETKNRSIRVTGDHRMVWRKRGQTYFQVSKASSLVNQNCELPLCGVAAPDLFAVSPQQPLKSSLTRRLSANSYRLRKKGMESASAEAEALRRIAHRDSLSRLAPHELSLDYCRWIGFWSGDGSVSRLSGGGLEYIVYGSDQWPAIANWFEALSKKCGFHFVKKRVRSNRDDRLPLTKWSFCRGTGFGPQHRQGGIYQIESYLDKNGSELLWGLTVEQFDAFVHGLWCADGNHGQSVSPQKNRALRIYSSNIAFMNHIQSIAVCRGYRANLQTKNNHGYTLYCLSLSKRYVHQATKFTLQKEVLWLPELVWCVKSQSGFIITRRNGAVTVTGNTEGFDAPSVSVILNGRPTKSRSLYAQCAGRALRPLPGVVDAFDLAQDRKAAIADSDKPSALLVDFVGNSGRHKLMSSADILGGKVSDEAIELATQRAKQEGRPTRMDEAVDEAAADIRKQQEERRKRDAARRKHLVAKVPFSRHAVDPFLILDIEPDKTRGWHSGKILSEKQRGLLQRQGIDPNSMTYAQGKQLISELFRRWDGDLCSLKQAKILRRYGYQTEVSRKEASAIIDVIAKNGWRKAG